MDNPTLKEMREDLMLTQAQMCEVFGDMKLSTYQHWEQGAVEPPKHVYNLILYKYNKIKENAL